MASNVRKGLVIAAGAVVFAGSVSVVHLWRKWIQRRSQKLEQRIEDGIGMEQLSILAKSSNVSLRRSAEQLLLDRITRRENFKFVLLCCRSQDEEQVLKACTVLCVILKSVDYRSGGMDTYILNTLADCLVRSMDASSFAKRTSDTSAPERIQRMTLAAIFDFICDSDEKKELLLNETESVSAILNLVQQTRSKEVLRYAMFLLHQMAKCGSAHGYMIQSGAIPVFASLSVSQHGDNVLQKLCFQILVILLNTPGLNVEVFLKQIATQRVLIRAAVSCKSDDGELAYWAIALLHEFAIHSNTKHYLYTMPFLLGNLQKALKSNPAQVQRLILRIISFMALHHDKFKSEVLDNSQLMEHLPVCLASGEPDIVHWGLVLVHDLAVAGSDQDVAGK
ncbi:uncharacterized protein [Amphiura filiformis]|uniref:uncharacterized protein n=1 Tax=Amphiura filiformis TaxID=82378 RepID=UPI003B21646F